MLLDISAVLPVRDMAKPLGPDNLGFVFPHPPWEQHAMFAQQIALHLAKFAAAAACKASSRAHGDDSGNESLGAASTTTKGATTVNRGNTGECAAGPTPPNAAIHDPGSDRSAGGSADCDGAESAWFEAKSAINIRSRTRGWNWAQSTRLAGIEAAPESDAKTAASRGSVAQPAEPTGTPSVATEWALFEDRPGKPGWILNSTGTADRPGRNLTFSLAVPW